MYQFTIEANEYLNQNIQGFYHTYYLGYGREGNPDYINNLKNTYCEKPEQTLEDAMNEVYSLLKEDILEIKHLLSVKNLTLCVVPRAKKEEKYHDNQKLFRETISIFANDYEKEGLEDGTHYLLRHTDTKTTHIKNPRNYDNSGDDPYPGITKETCTIDNKVQGKDILLIDDIYTKTVNIDEDAIQALLEAGANSVTFYAIAKTYYSR